MKKTVILNVAKFNFDEKLDFCELEKISLVSKFNASTNEQILQRVQGQNILITKELPLCAELIRQFPPCVELICEAGTGYNNIDIAAAREKGITVCNLPGYSTDSVAQVAIAFILNLSSSLKEQQLMIERKQFDNFTKHLHVPHFELQGKVLGVIGAGTIGKQVIKVARALGMSVLYYNRHEIEFNDSNIHYASMEELLGKSDFVTLHCPLNADTKHLLNKDKLALMKPTAYVINTSRGALIKESDLVEALKSGQIAGAGLDVQEVEPIALDNPLLSMDNVIITPHIGWQTLEARQRIVVSLTCNIASFSDGKPINVVN